MYAFSNLWQWGIGRGVVPDRQTEEYLSRKLRQRINLLSRLVSATGFQKHQLAQAGAAEINAGLQALGDSVRVSYRKTPVAGSVWLVWEGNSRGEHVLPGDMAVSASARREGDAAAAAALFQDYGENLGEAMASHEWLRKAVRDLISRASREDVVVGGEPVRYAVPAGMVRDLATFKDLVRSHARLRRGYWERSHTPFVSGGKLRLVGSRCQKLRGAGDAGCPQPGCAPGDLRLPPLREPREMASQRTMSRDTAPGPLGTSQCLLSVPSGVVAGRRDCVEWLQGPHVLCSPPRSGGPPIECRELGNVFDLGMMRDVFWVPGCFWEAVLDLVDPGDER